MYSSRFLRLVPSLARGRASSLAVRTTSRFQSTYASQWVQKPIDTKTAEFTIGPKNGFLPVHDPLVKLPARFSALENILDRMPKILPDGKPGLLAKGTFASVIDKELPEYDVSDINDPHLLLALFRDYTFATSAYLLEPCDLRYVAEGKYGKGRTVLPRNLAVPLSQIAQKIGQRPFMEYALSYALANYQRADKDRPEEYDNLSLIRTFSGGPSEHGFILTHVAMVRHSGGIIATVPTIFDAVKAKDRSKFNAELDKLNSTMSKINAVMETMWKVSAPSDYGTFRTFIMGTKSQDEMFPQGVVYEGVSKDPTFYRGESGANDSIVPTMDNLLQLTEMMPSNELTDILRDFRSYRPPDHTKWLSFVESTSKELGVRNFALADAGSTLRYLTAMDEVRDFRNRHWNFAKEYILKYSKHPVATGGSPIKTWLPNQLTTVLDVMIKTGNESLARHSGMDAATKAGISTLIERAEQNYKTLKR
eukprot:TRINITY_DN2187_c0_g1_i3.p1 TRINITY_DN2187_c0_g1~~TRINITY_DN2187_c0_g1_i3.p1  ORF type:complete len:478 (-),score=138.43 TRINITY_DN2187_c0_g1_i3:71-1504(-)